MVKISGAMKHRARLKRMAGGSGSEMVRQVGAALVAAGNLIEVEAALSITNGAQSGKNHVPSAPGEPPNADTHVLDRSITTTQVAPLKVVVSADAPYAVALEFGTSKMQARPFMSPAVAKNRDEATDIIRRAVKKVVTDGGKVVP